jgi:hypothetical protein
LLYALDQTWITVLLPTITHTSGMTGTCHHIWLVWLRWGSH